MVSTMTSIKRNGRHPNETTSNFHEALDKDRFGRPRHHTLNVQTVLTECPDLFGCFALNQLTQMVEIVRPAPWRGYTGPIEDVDFTHFLSFLNGLGLMPSRETAAKALEAVAEQNEFHPVRDYLDGLVWDNEPRLESVLLDVLQLRNSAYERAVIKRFLVSAIARAYEPGCKVDTMLILEGGQGVGKSTALGILAGSAWFLDTLSDIGSGKTAQEQLRGKWLVEIAELDAMSKAEATKTKSFLSTRADNYRMPYARLPRDFPRSCVFAGTTNESAYLVDSTGARRFWPVSVQGPIDCKRLTVLRDQIWAEAVHLYKSGVQWYLTDKESDLALSHQSLRLARDPWEDVLAEGLRCRAFPEGHPPLIAQRELYDMVGVMAERRHVGHAKRLTKVMKSLGWEHVGEKRLFVDIDGKRKGIKATCYEKIT